MSRNQKLVALINIQQRTIALTASINHLLGLLPFPVVAAIGLVAFVVAAICLPLRNP